MDTVCESYTNAKRANLVCVSRFLNAYITTGPGNIEEPKKMPQGPPAIPIRVMTDEGEKNRRLVHDLEKIMANAGFADAWFILLSRSLILDRILVQRG